MTTAQQIHKAMNDSDVLVEKIQDNTDEMVRVHNTEIKQVTWLVKNLMEAFTGQPFGKTEQFKKCSK